ncbi:VPLPA-CTERM protein sorting domain-containing protein [Poseidonocella pacifica]|uniref:VPLPA-CTERM protein sorting domain-containing protein n=1 Tax=Poseidonocella pacifica TaxID=871651 RepID=A0A1I0VUW5_9RHOB|nr:VPLPA-CTERM sorting domain-containing protein [Poseidonocella pacifica]SFA80205.1 VPLPA-CTERM protein sorting domain-containing protein [Poseidonocella pacifica]
MKFSTIFAVAGFAALPLGASAATLSGTAAPGGTYDISAAAYDFQAGFDNGDTAGSYEFTFENGSSSILHLVLGSVTVNQLRTVAGFTGGVGVSFGSTTETVEQGQSASFSFSEMLNPGETTSLVFNFGDAYGSSGVGPDLDFIVEGQPAPVPLPAALPLMGVALGGLGLMARRKKANA